MEQLSVQLRQFVQESLHPRNLAGQQITFEEFRKWKNFMEAEISKVFFQIQTFSALPKNCRENGLLAVIAEITDLSNTVNQYLTKFIKAWGNNPAGNEIKAHYLYTCEAFDELLDTLFKRYPVVAGNTKFSDFALRQILPELRLQLLAVDKHLKAQRVGEELRAVLTEAIDHLISQKVFTRNEDSYLHKIMAAMIRKSFENDIELSDFLIIQDFNMPEFFLFCVANWNQRLANLDGLYEQKEMLLDEKSHLYDLTISAGLKNPLVKHRLYIELNTFLTEKYAIVKERVKLSRQWNNQTDTRLPARRFLINLSVAQLGLFIRMQIERGFLAKEHVGELFAFYARHFYTPNTEFMSAESLQKKSTVIEHATAKKLKSHLISMLNWLNTNYNLSNYN